LWLLPDALHKTLFFPTPNFRPILRVASAQQATGANGREGANCCCHPFYLLGWHRLSLLSWVPFGQMDDWAAAWQQKTMATNGGNGTNGRREMPREEQSSYWNMAKRERRQQRQNADGPLTRHTHTECHRDKQQWRAFWTVTFSGCVDGVWVHLPSQAPHPFSSFAHTKNGTKNHKAFLWLKNVKTGWKMSQDQPNG
jgi:hypothetical protein